MSAAETVFRNPGFAAGTSSFFRQRDTPMTTYCPVFESHSDVLQADLAPRSGGLPPVSANAHDADVAALNAQAAWLKDMLAGFAAD